MRPLRALAAMLALAAVLAAGVALGMALRANPRPSGPIVVEYTVTLPAEAPPAGATVPPGP